MPFRSKSPFSQLLVAALWVWTIFVVLIVLLTIIFGLAKYEDRSYLDYIVETVLRMHIHINALGYLLISAALLIIWLVTFLLFDPQI